MVEVGAILEKRKSFAIECKDLFQEYYEGFRYEDFYSGAWVFQYQASANVTLSVLPRTMISGPVTDIDFWTDGAILLKQRGRPRPTDAIIAFDRPMGNLLKAEFRVQKGFLVIHPDLQPHPYVLMLSERKWALYDARYVDYAVKHGHPGEFYFNSEETGVLLRTGHGIHAYISEVATVPWLTMKLTSLVEKLYAICGN